MSLLNCAAAGVAGPHVLLLHGIPGSSATWSSVARELAPRHRVLMPDLLGFGGSPLFEHDGHAGEQAAAVLRMLDGRGVDRVHLAGFDFGGPVAVRMYRMAPDRILSLTLAATNLFPDTPIPTPLLIARIPILGEAAFRVAFSRPGLGLMWAAATGDRTRFRYSDFAHVLRSPNGVRTTRHIFLISLRHLRRYYAEIAATLPGIRVPTSIVWGDRDPFFSVSVGQRVAEAIPGSQLEVLKGCGHFVPGERSSELAAVIERVIVRANAVTDHRSSKTANSR